MDLAGSAAAREPAGSAEAREPAGSVEASALVPQSAAGQQEATGVMPAWRLISIAGWVLPAAVWAPASVREWVATQLTSMAAWVVPVAVQTMAMGPTAKQVTPPTGPATATAPTAEQVEPPAGQTTATRPTVVAMLPAAVVPAPQRERAPDRHSSLAGEAPAPGLAMARSVAVLAPLPAERVQRTQRIAERTG